MTVQQRVDGKQKWSVQMYWTRVGGRCVSNHQNQTTYAWTTPFARILYDEPLRKFSFFSAAACVLPDAA